MELRLIPSSSSSTTYSLDTTNSSSNFSSIGFTSKLRSLLIASAKNNKKNKRKDKPDTHSFVVKPEEATGPFPEAVLLKQKVVKGDGRVVPEFADADEEKLYQFLSLELESNLNVERNFIREKKERIYRVNNWGLRRLAYKIKKAKKTNYILMNFEIEAKGINAFKTMLDQDERIIRHLVIKCDEAITEDFPPPPEFHTLKGEEDDDEDEEDEDDQDWEEEDDDENVILVRADEEDDDDDDDDDVRSSRNLKFEKAGAR